MTENTTQARFRFKGDLVHELTVPDAKNTTLPPVYAFGIKKGGSTMMSKMIRDLLPHSEYSYFELPRELFSTGLPMFKLIEDCDDVLTRPGYVFGTFRWLPNNEIVSWNNKHAKLLLVRDPRDVLVSLYFSDKGSHALPQEGPLKEAMERKREKLEETDIDTYVVEESKQVLMQYYRTMQLLASPRCQVVRYRDIIYDKRGLVSKLAEMMQIPADHPVIDEVAKAHDIIPNSEKEASHIRQVHPGNYKKKLKK